MRPKSSRRTNMCSVCALTLSILPTLANAVDAESAVEPGPAAALADEDATSARLAELATLVERWRAENGNAPLIEHRLYNTSGDLIGSFIELRLKEGSAAILTGVDQFGRVSKVPLAYEQLSGPLAYVGLSTGLFDAIRSNFTDGQIAHELLGARAGGTARGIIGMEGRALDILLGHGGGPQLPDPGSFLNINATNLRPGTLARSIEQAVGGGIGATGATSIATLMANPASLVLGGNRGAMAAILVDTPLGGLEQTAGSMLGGDLLARAQFKNSQLGLGTGAELLIGFGLGIAAELLVEYVIKPALEPKHDVVEVRGLRDSEGNDTLRFYGEDNAGDRYLRTEVKFREEQNGEAFVTTRFNTKGEPQQVIYRDADAEIVFPLYTIEESDITFDDEPPPGGGQTPPGPAQTPSDPELASGGQRHLTREQAAAVLQQALESKFGRLVLRTEEGRQRPPTAEEVADLEQGIRRDLDPLVLTTDTEGRRRPLTAAEKGALVRPPEEGSPGTRGTTTSPGTQRTPSGGPSGTKTSPGQQGRTTSGGSDSGDRDQGSRGLPNPYGGSEDHPCVRGDYNYSYATSTNFALVCCVPPTEILRPDFPCIKPPPWLPRDLISTRSSGDPDYDKLVNCRILHPTSLAPVSISVCNVPPQWTEIPTGIPDPFER